MKGYDTGVVDAHEHCDAAHDTRPLPLELMGFPEVAVDTGVQQADDSWNRQPLCVRSRLSLVNTGSLSLLHKRAVSVVA